MPKKVKIIDFSLLPFIFTSKVASLPQKWQGYLKSGKVLDDKVIDGDVELDRYRIVNTRKKSLFL